MVESVDSKILKVISLTINGNELKEGMKKYIQYSLKCTVQMSKGERNIDLKKRYSDFFTLRKKLVERWPGVYIPNIPPKKAIGNLDGGIIETRKRILNKFCEKITKNSYLSEAEEVIAFVSSTDSKDIEKLPGFKAEEVLEKYQKAFKTYYEAYDLNLGQKKLIEFKEMLNTIEKTIKVIFIITIIAIQRLCFCVFYKEGRRKCKF